MDSFQKLAYVANQTRFEADDDLSISAKSPPPPGCGWTDKQLQEVYGQRSPANIIQAKGQSVPIHLAAVPGGRRFPLLKVMLTTACERHCLYCPFQAGRDHRRVTFKPDELARVVMQAHRAGWIEGVFLSTGLFDGGVNTQNKVLDTAELLRHKMQYSGYLHIKIMPGAEEGQVLRAMQLADRVSTNLEAPNGERLRRLAPEKKFKRELLNPLQWAQEIRKNTPSQLGWQGRWPSTSTQFVVGPAGETDVELLSTVEHLYAQLQLKRVYFEAFSPVRGTPMESQPAENPLRQQRLYEASFLLRDYGFSLEELPFTSDGELPLERDPKRVYADHFLRESPVELNLAERELLIRVPGIGPQTVDRLLTLRRQGRLKDIDRLRSLRLITERSAPYITVDGRRPGHQKMLF
ncbi:MAG: radical SAM protein [Anaerolineales bacterium]|jgi:predicted DNA-binding helix-hairpin-helix protein